MGLRELLRRLAGAEDPDRNRDADRLAPRRARREAARNGHRANGRRAAWDRSDRHENPDPGLPVDDLAPGTPGAGASRRWLGRRRGR